MPSSNNEPGCLGFFNLQGVIVYYELTADTSDVTIVGAYKNALANHREIAGAILCDGGMRLPFGRTYREMLDHPRRIPWAEDFRYRQLALSQFRNPVAVQVDYHFRNETARVWVPELSYPIVVLEAVRRYLDTPEELSRGFTFHWDGIRNVAAESARIFYRYLRGESDTLPEGPMPDTESSRDTPLPPLVLPDLDNPRAFGVEVEFTIVEPWTSEDVALEMRRKLGDEVTLPVYGTGYEHSDGTAWHFKPDSSCGLELASPILTWATWDQLELVLTKLKSLGVQVTQRCGLHVHHDVSDFSVRDLRRLLVLWAALEKGLFVLVAPERLDNRYCRSIRGSNNYDDLLSDLVPMSRVEEFTQSMGKYRTLNCTNFWKNGTVEVRMHHGTLDTRTIRFWVMVTQRLIDAAKSTRDFNTLSELFDKEAKEHLNEIKKRVKSTTLAAAMDVVTTIHHPAGA